MPEALRFPLEDQDWYEGKITFQVRQEEPPAIVVSGRSNVDLDERTDVPAEENSTFADLVGSLSQLTTSPGGQVTLGDKVTLYMPKAISISDNVSYDGAKLGRIGAVVESEVRAGGANLGSLAARATTANPFSSLVSVLDQSATPDAARVAIARAAQSARQEFRDGVTSALRTTTNPNARQIFQEVSFREFTFNFQLAPTSRREAEISKEIIKFFRTELYPDEITVGTASTQIPVGYRFPNTFDIRFKHKNTNIVHRLLPCYLRNVQVTYNPTGASFFEDGNFSEVEMSLVFVESRTLTKGLVRDGGY